MLNAQFDRKVDQTGQKVLHSGNTDLTCEIVVSVTSLTNSQRWCFLTVTTICPLP